MTANDFHVPILMYHRVSPDPLAADLECYSLLHMVVSVDTFRRQARFLRQHRRVIPLLELVTAIRTRTALPKHACVITFDDSYKDHYLHAFPTLLEFGLPATFFLETGHTAELGAVRCLDEFYYLLDHTRYASLEFRCEGLSLSEHPLDRLSKLPLVQDSGLKRLLKLSSHERQKALLNQLANALDVRVSRSSLAQSLYLSRAEISEMSRAGMEFGAHTVTHVPLQDVAESVARREVSESYAFIENLSGGPVAFAYPFGEGCDSTAVTSLVHDCGFYACCTAEPGLVSPRSDPHRLPRIAVEEDTIRA